MRTEELKGVQLNGPWFPEWIVKKYPNETPKIGGYAKRRARFAKLSTEEQVEYVSFVKEKLNVLDAQDAEAAAMSSDQLTGAARLACGKMSNMGLRAGNNSHVATNSSLHQEVRNTYTIVLQDRINTTYRPTTRRVRRLSDTPPVAVRESGKYLQSVRVCLDWAHLPPHPQHRQLLPSLGNLHSVLVNWLWDRLLPLTTKLTRTYRKIPPYLLPGQASQLPLSFKSATLQNESQCSKKITSLQRPSLPRLGIFERFSCH